jgi:hypothetical protein
MSVCLDKYFYGSLACETFCTATGCRKRMQLQQVEWPTKSPKLAGWPGNDAAHGAFSGEVAPVRRRKRVNEMNLDHDPIPSNRIMI